DLNTVNLFFVDTLNPFAVDTLVPFVVDTLVPFVVDTLVPFVVDTLVPFVVDTPVSFAKGQEYLSNTETKDEPVQDLSILWKPIEKSRPNIQHGIQRNISKNFLQKCLVKSTVPTRSSTPTLSLRNDLLKAEMRDFRIWQQKDISGYGARQQKNITVQSKYAIRILAVIGLLSVNVFFLSMNSSSRVATASQKYI
ncbi:hypothetical protein Btru_076075, partial [Bulinus truncatus]